jgi:hypothetical protein
MLAQLLRVNLILRAYVPGTETRRLREAVRQRVFLVRLRTMVKNRIQALRISSCGRRSENSIFGDVGKYLGDGTRHTSEGRSDD